ncbi:MULTISPECIES: hypothetical protein [Streptomyces]|uniref:Uncharacterized protein n=1 Tax=Streptomyces evansiae TaxID=3075535 RepID=A0ABU2QWZ8_9ACTN|nr:MULTISPECIES: hypothetical protein [unclassified Streptomyces]MDT0407714.1 hypothetical protein [Streptomyces sp. DSM 41979]MYQ57370.1 hypothetical protein [Streptomyces sp. SID4926]SCD87523.1 hypothetical protein GA0115252_122632 [Streptomyces sp. DfronAA-171]
MPMRRNTHPDGCDIAGFLNPLGSVGGHPAGPLFVQLDQEAGGEEVDLAEEAW